MVSLGFCRKRRAVLRPLDVGNERTKFLVHETTQKGGSYFFFRKCCFDCLVFKIPRACLVKYAQQSVRHTKLNTGKTDKA